EEDEPFEAKTLELLHVVRGVVAELLGMIELRLEPVDRLAAALDPTLQIGEGVLRELAHGRVEDLAVPENAGVLAEQVAEHRAAAAARVEHAHASLGAADGRRATCQVAGPKSIDRRRRVCRGDRFGAETVGEVGALGLGEPLSADLL